ncbi:putative protein OS=Streptomyces tendae OX=1932 GN=GUR47_26580 PE=4 SV=1 [Streptomyces tendae]
MNHAQLTALGRALRLLGEHGEALTADTPEAKLHEVRADLKRALDQLEESVTTAAPAPAAPSIRTGRSTRPPRPVPAVRDPPPHGPPRGVQRRTAAGPARRAGPVPLQHTGDRPQPQQRWLPEQWTGQAWQLCGTPRRDRREAELYIAAQLRGPRAAMAYRLVHEFTDYKVLRVWGTPVRVDIEPMGGL